MLHCGGTGRHGEQRVTPRRRGAHRQGRVARRAGALHRHPCTATPVRHHPRSVVARGSFGCTDGTTTVRPLQPGRDWRAVGFGRACPGAAITGPLLTATLLGASPALAGQLDLT
jgi:hypothetical protein